MGEDPYRRAIVEIDAALQAGWDKLTFVPTSISFQGGRAVSFAPIINPTPWLARWAVTAEDISDAWEALDDG